jgi:hypothetical protein
VLVLAALVLALASPAPNPTATNPFTLDPIPAGTPLPLIGTTRTRALCSAMHRVIAPAVAAAMGSDKTYAGFRTSLRDYLITATTSSRDLKITVMDRTVLSMVKSVDKLETTLNSGDWEPPANAAAGDKAALANIHQSLAGVLAAQKVQLDAMSGWLETERARTFGQLSETENNLRNSTGIASSPPLPIIADPMAPDLQTNDTSYAFKHDSSTFFQGKPTSSLAMANNLDRDLGDLGRYTAQREAVAAKIIIPATNLCK